MNFFNLVQCMRQNLQEFGLRNNALLLNYWSQMQKFIEYVTDDHVYMHLQM